MFNEIMYNPRPIRQQGQITATTLLDWGATWRFNESGADLGNTWETTSHSVGGAWQSGVGTLGFENDPLPVPIATILSSPNGRAVYFETDLNLTAAEMAALDEVQLSPPYRRWSHLLPQRRGDSVHSVRHGPRAH